MRRALTALGAGLAVVAIGAGAAVASVVAAHSSVTTVAAPVSCPVCELNLGDDAYQDSYEDLENHVRIHHPDYWEKVVGTERGGAPR